MSTADAAMLADVLQRVKSWPSALRIKLARRILESLDDAEAPAASPALMTRGLSTAEIRGLLSSSFAHF
jgi:hypothetical protein